MGEIVLTDALLEMLGDIYINHADESFKEEVTFAAFVDGYLRGNFNVKF
jgi:hypothetical protein